MTKIKGKLMYGGGDLVNVIVIFIIIAMVLFALGFAIYKAVKPSKPQPTTSKIIIPAKK